MAQNNNPQFWKQVKPGGRLAVRQALARKYNLLEGTNPNGMEIRSIVEIEAQKGIAMWRLFRLELEGRWLMAKLVDQALALSILREPADWEPLTRRELLEQDIRFLFQPPGRDDFNPDELRFSTELRHTVDGRDRMYYLKSQGELHGRAMFIPPESGMDVQYATVAEYAVEEGQEVNEPELSLIEIGAAGCGVIKLLLGGPVAPEDVLVRKEEFSD